MPRRKTSDPKNPIVASTSPRRRKAVSTVNPPVVDKEWPANEWAMLWQPPIAPCELVPQDMLTDVIQLYGDNPAKRGSKFKSALDERRIENLFENWNRSEHWNALSGLYIALHRILNADRMKELAVSESSRAGMDRLKIALDQQLDEHVNEWEYGTGFKAESQDASPNSVTHANLKSLITHLDHSALVRSGGEFPPFDERGAEIFLEKWWKSKNGCQLDWLRMHAMLEDELGENASKNVFSQREIHCLHIIFWEMDRLLLRLTTGRGLQDAALMDAFNRAGERAKQRFKRRAENEGIEIANSIIDQCAEKAVTIFLEWNRIDNMPMNKFPPELQHQTKATCRHLKDWLLEHLPQLDVLTPGLGNAERNAMRGFLDDARKRIIVDGSSEAVEKAAKAGKARRRPKAEERPHARKVFFKSWRPKLEKEESNGEAMTKWAIASRFILYCKSKSYKDPQLSQVERWETQWRAGKIPEDCK